MGYRTTEYAVEKVFEILRVLLAIEQRDPGMLDLQAVTGLNYRTVQKYTKALENMGLVKVEPKERKNVIRLTERGRCLARCLIQS